MTDSLAIDPRQQAILDAALQAFAAYGYRKTSMDDIAQGAGMSRPAVYMHYRNKQDIFRSLTRVFYDQGLARFSDELDQDGPVAEVLTAAFLSKTRPNVQIMMNSQHGRELIDANHATAADIVADGEARLIATLAQWLTRQAAAGRISLVFPAEQVARLCEMTVIGLFQTCDTSEAFFSDVSAFCHLLGRGLSAP